jgi:hypothetical protein
LVAEPTTPSENLLPLRFANACRTLGPEMPRWFVALFLGGSALLAFACNDETVEVVPKDVCYSEMRWVGEKRGSPEMYPGRDCVGCHIDNDGPPLALGGTVYPYVVGNDVALASQSGEDCFGKEGVRVQITDLDGQTVETVTNRAGNFFIEGNPDDFEKPFNVQLVWIDDADGTEKTTPMFTAPSYGGCGRCHNPSAEAFPPPGEMDVEFGADELVRPTARIGLPNYGPGADGYQTVGDELEAMAEANPAVTEE